jgi:hypothetical protein
LAENIAVQIGAGQVSVLGTFTVDGWRTTGTTTIDGGNITANTITADAIKTSTLNAKTITLGTTGGDSIIKSGNYSAGSAGWQIKANGDAEFNNVTVRGTIGTSSIGTGATVTVVGAIESDNYIVGTSGWYLSGSGTALFTGLGVVTGITCEGTIAAEGIVQSDVGFGIDDTISSASARGGSIYSTDGITLYWKDIAGNSHALY